MPDEVITDSVRATASGDSTCSPVTGLTPPLASVAAITARSRARDQDRALPEIDVEHRVDIVFHDAVIAQHPADGAVAVAGRGLGLIDGFVDIELASGEAAEHGRISSKASAPFAA